MKLIVLGNYGTFPGRGGACSGYLLRDDNTNILIDCGNGVLSRLQEYIGIEEIDAIVLSHLHRDHSSDMYVLKYAVETRMEFGTMDKVIEVYAPPTPKTEQDALTYEKVFNITDIHNGMEIDIKGFKFKFFSMDHSVESYGMRIENEGKIISYTGDTLYNPNLYSLAENADLFLCESTATMRMKSSVKIPHLSAKEAAEIALSSNVKKLVLTHFWYEEDRLEYLKEASMVFKDVILSVEMEEYEV